MKIKMFITNFSIITMSSNVEFIKGVQIFCIGQQLIDVNICISAKTKNEIIVSSSNRTFLLYAQKQVDVSVQQNELLKDLERLKGFLHSVDQKLNNRKFVQNAKSEIVELERKKKADAETRIRSIEENLSSLQ